MTRKIDILRDVMEFIDEEYPSKAEAIDYLVKECGYDSVRAFNYVEGATMVYLADKNDPSLQRSRHEI